MERLRFENELRDLGIYEPHEIPMSSGEVGRKPVLLKHFHVRKVYSGGAGLLSDPDATVMEPSRMNPRFVDPTDEQRKKLQTKLTNLIETKFNSAVSPGGGVSPGLGLRIALVDLTETKHHNPIFACRAEHDSIEGGSLPKILALYAMFQLRFDLNVFAGLNGIKKGSTLKESILKEWRKAGLVPELAPKLERLFRFNEKAGSTVEVELLNKNPSINSNVFARNLIIALGFDYIGSVALQSGLFDEKLGGLWLNSAYLKPRFFWSKSPIVTGNAHNATAHAAASFFTLLAQGRLVNQTTSNEIAEVLKKENCFKGGMLDGIITLPGSPLKSPNKCGLICPFYHEAILMERQPPRGRHLQYVAVVLSQQHEGFCSKPKRAPFSLSFVELGKDLDALIASQNPP